MDIFNYVKLIGLVQSATLLTCVEYFTVQIITETSFTSKAGFCNFYKFPQTNFVIVP